MHLSHSCTLVACLFLPVTVAAQAPAGEAPAMECKAGPLARTFGGTPWNVYACADRTSIVVVTKEGNPATPFYFFIFKRDGKYVVYGEGTGAKSVTDLAYNELTKLGTQEVASLISAAQRVSSEERR
jgi:hypothetical protein